ncbi:MAG: right-handed parallel beta-helix repeat-containing protein [Candidatus Latescibacterota bacterium]|nr:right-handed parallel beta-helix repeat-containing protein [Candidatus Latescibacterota bacterium]
MFAAGTTSPAAAALYCAQKTLAVARPAQGGLRPEGVVRALAVFARFRDESDASEAAPDFASRLFDADVPGSLTHFYDEMSRGQFLLTGTALPRVYTSRDVSTSYQRGQFERFVREILDAVDADTDLSLYDNDGADGRPNSGDDDGYVDFVFVVARSTPAGFIRGQATGIAGLGLAGDFVSSDRGMSGNFIRVGGDARQEGIGGVLQQGAFYAEAVGSMAHEFGHALDLPDLFNTAINSEGGGLDPAEDKAGIGYWGLMGHGARGWDDRGGPTPFCAWSLEQLGWIGIDNDRLVEVTGQLRDAILADVNNGGKVYRLPTSTQNVYYLVEHRARGASYYERDLPAEGVLIWRFDHGLDLVCADGRFSDAGFPVGEESAPETGGDNLDFWAHDVEYSRDHAGNLGDGTDPFDGEVYTQFFVASNPSADQGVSVTGIRRVGSVMMANLSVRDRRRAGLITQNEIWTDTVEVVADVVIAPEARLDIAHGAVVLFGEDLRGQGADPDLCELVVWGDLLGQGRAGRGSQILMTSASPQPRPGDWFGIVVGSSGRVQLQQTTIEHAQYGLLGRALTRDQLLLDVLIRGSEKDGVSLQLTRGIHTLSRVEVTDTGGAGVRIAGPARFLMEHSLLARNRDAGLVRTGGFVQIFDSEFIDNGESEGGANLVLGLDSFGTIRGNRLQGGVGIRCDQADAVFILNNVLQNHRVALVSGSSQPSFVSNTISGSEVAMRFSGFRLPARVELNAVVGSDSFIQNLTDLQLLADNNWWGTDDAERIARGMEGAVQYLPFLNFDTRFPVAFELRQNYPNPFNASTVIDYSIGIMVASISSGSLTTLDVRNVAGGLVRRLVDEAAAPGIFSATWDGTGDDGRSVASGVYLYELRVGGILLAGKLTYIR